MLASLLLKQAQAFLKYEYYEFALKISKILVDLCPESFECWLVLAESYFHERKFKNALIAIDVAPSYEDINDELVLPDLTKYARTNPKTQNSTDIYPEMMVKPENPDYKFTENSKISNVPADYEAKVLQGLEKANIEAYDLLVKIEKEISWEQLLKLKGETFLSEGDEADGWENPYLNADYTKQGTSAPKGVNESFYAIQKSANMFLKEKNKHEDEDDEEEAKHEIHGQIIEEENVEETKQTEPIDAAGDRRKTRTRANNEILNTANVEDAPVTFASLPSEAEGEGEEEEVNNPLLNVHY